MFEIKQYSLVFTSQDNKICKVSIQEECANNQKKISFHSIHSISNKRK